MDWFIGLIMPLCLDPILAVSVCKNSDDKHVLKFIPKRDIEKMNDLKSVYGSDDVFLLPCGRCPACREAYAKDWAARASIEARMHKFNYFITLTYDDIHLKFFSKSDFSQKFLKSLGYFLTGERVRPLFFSCLEKGELTGRYHFHAILFLDHELKLTDCVKKGDFYHYHSPVIAKCWPFGLHDITPFEHDCAAYVAKYATKSGKCSMSRNLARSYYEAHALEIVKDDFKIYVDFNKRNYIDVPKCFVRWFLEDFPNRIKNYKFNKKQLQRLLLLADIHTKKMTGEDIQLADQILAYLKHNIYAKERSDF